MYLYDYQKTQLRKIRRADNYIIQGSRGIGVTTILLNYALIHITDVPGDYVTMLSKSFALAKTNLNSLRDIIYAAKGGNVSVFDKTLNVLRVDDGNRVIFSNGSTIEFTSAEFFDGPNFVGSGVDVLLVDDAMALKRPFDFTMFSKVILGFTGGFDKASPVYKLYLDSLRGKNDFEYIKLPWELSSKLREYVENPQNMNCMSDQMWNEEFELLNRSQ